MNKNEIIKMGDVYDNYKKVSGNGHGGLYYGGGIAPTITTSNTHFTIVKVRGLIGKTNGRK